MSYLSYSFYLHSFLTILLTSAVGKSHPHRNDSSPRKVRGRSMGRLQQAPHALNVGLLQVLADEFRHLEH